MAYDLGLEGGTIVSGSGRHQGNLYVNDGIVAAISTEQLESRERQDCSGLFVLPGMIDGHVHFQDPGDTSREDFISGSSAAAVGGVTTVIEHTHSHPVRAIQFLKDKLAHLKNRSVVDYGLAAHVWPEDVARLEEPWRAGIQFFKVFTCTTHGVPAILPGTLLELFRKVASLDGLCLVHCEDEFITADNEKRLRDLGRKDYGILLEWRTREAEQLAASIVALLARLTNARTIIAHVSHPAVLDIITRERRAGGNLWVESCPQYFYLREDEVFQHGPLRKFTPPARSEAEGQNLWERVVAGEITHISTDHSPSTLAQKAEGKDDMWQCHFGLPGIQTTLTMLLNAVNVGHLTLEQVVKLTAETPAQLYRLWPKKGSLHPGADADLVLVDLSSKKTLTNASMLSRAGWTPYEGMEVEGFPIATYVRGKLVAQDGKMMAPPGTGEFIRGSGAR